MISYQLLLTIIKLTCFYNNICICITNSMNQNVIRPNISQTQITSKLGQLQLLLANRG